MNEDKNNIENGLAQKFWLWTSVQALFCLAPRSGFRGV